MASEQMQSNVYREHTGLHSFWARLKEQKPLPFVAKSLEDMAPKASRSEEPCCENEKDTTAGARRSWLTGASWELRHLSRCWQKEMMFRDHMGQDNAQQMPAWTNETHKPNVSPTYPTCPDSEKSLGSLWELRSCLHKKDDGVRKSWIEWENKGIYYPDWLSFPVRKHLATWDYKLEIK